MYEWRHIDLHCPACRLHRDLEEMLADASFPLHATPNHPSYARRWSRRIPGWIVLSPHSYFYPINSTNWTSLFPAPLSVQHTEWCHESLAHTADSEVYSWRPRDSPWQCEAGSSVGKLHPAVYCVNRSRSPVSRGHKLCGPSFQLLLSGVGCSIIC